MLLEVASLELAWVGSTVVSLRARLLSRQKVCFAVAHLLIPQEVAWISHRNYCNCSLQTRSLGFRISTYLGQVCSFLDFLSGPLHIATLSFTAALAIHTL